MQILDVIERAQQGRAIANLAATFGVDERKVRAAADAALPELALALERNTLSRNGLAAFVRALGDGHHEALLDNPTTWNDPRVAADGKAILAHILGTDAKARVLTDRAAKASGLGGSIIEALLPILAQMLMGAISRYMKGGLGDILSRLPSPNNAPGSGTARSDGSSHETGGTMPDNQMPGGFELPREKLPPAGGFPMPPISPSPDGDSMPLPKTPNDDGRSGGFGLPWPGSDSSNAQNRQDRGGQLGAPTDEEGRPSGGFNLPKYEMPTPDGSGRSQADGRKDGFPLPLPESDRNNPYGDLSDILKRGGSTPNENGGSLWSIVRKMLGGALGFGGSGFFGWLVRFIIVRWGWTALRRVLFGR